MTSLAAPRISNLIVVLNEIDEGRARDFQTGRPPPPLLPSVPLALIEVAVFDRRNKLLRLAQIVRVIGFLAPGHRDHRAVMEIVVPERVNSATALLRRPDEDRLLRLVFGDDDDRTPSRG